MLLFASFARRRLAPLAGLGALLAVAPSCAENGTSLYIVGVLPRERPECTYTPSGSATILLRGVLDIAFSYEYQAGLMIASQIQSRGDSDTLRTEPNHLQLHGAEVELSDVNGELDNGYFTVSATGFVPAAQGDTAGRGVLSATLIPDVVGFDIARELASEGVGARKEVIARVRAFGETLSGVTIDSGEFLFPIDVCLGCLIYFPLDAIDYDSQGNGVCAANPEGADPLPCLPLGVDDAVDCRNCASENALCHSL